MRVVLADDEPLAIRGLIRLLEGEADVEVVGVARNGDDALRIVNAQTPDLVFLDIRMPGLSGLDVAASVSDAGKPDIVFVTAFDSYAAEAFSVEAVDYLLKPVQLERLRQSLQRARRRQAERGAYQAFAPVVTAPSLHVPDRHGGTDIAQSDIVWIEAAKDYGLVHTDRRSHILRITMAELAGRLHSDIMRVHRSAFVALSCVERIIPAGKSGIALTLNEGTEVPVGPSYVKSVRAALTDLQRNLGRSLI